MKLKWATRSAAKLADAETAAKATLRLDANEVNALRLKAAAADVTQVEYLRRAVAEALGTQTKSQARQAGTV
jgi:hypothetical protein